MVGNLPGDRSHYPGGLTDSGWYIKRFIYVGSGSEETRVISDHVFLSALGVGGEPYLYGADRLAAACRGLSGLVLGVGAVQ